jgi:Na+/proline symporter
MRATRDTFHILARGGKPVIFLVCIIAYLLLLAVVGGLKSRDVKSQADFAVAGRSLSPWIMVCTMLAVWIGTGSIVGNAEQTYETGMAAFLIPLGAFFGMILLSLIASRARSIEASSVPEIIERRFGHVARTLALISLVIAYMVIVSYQFNAGGAVLEVITGNRAPVTVQAGDPLSRGQLVKGRLMFRPDKDWMGETSLTVSDAEPVGDAARSFPFVIRVVEAKDYATTKRELVTARGELAERWAEEEVESVRDELRDARNTAPVKRNSFTRLRFDGETLADGSYVIQTLPEHGTLELLEPILTARTATIIAAVFIIAYTACAGLMSLAYMDIITGTVIMVTMVVAFPIYWFQAGGWEGIEAAYAAMGDRPQHMQLWGVYSPTNLINYILPVFLLVLGDANQYQRIFASRNASGARIAVTVMIFVALAIELLIIACAWVAGSMTPDPENGAYILIYAARHYLALPLGCLFMVTVVAIIVSTANSFLHVPATTVINDLYLNYINPQASQKRIIAMSRIMVVVFGVIGYLVTLAFAETTGFFQKALYAFTIYGASVTPALVAAIVWPRATKAGAITSILAGTVISLVWSEAAWLHRRLPPWISDLDAVLPALLASVSCLIVVSLLTTNKQTDTTSRSNPA